MSNASSGNPGNVYPNATAQTPDAGDNISSPVMQLQTMNEAANIWTAEAMKSAQPCNILEIDDDVIEGERAREQLSESREQAVPGSPGSPQEEIGDPEQSQDLETVLGYSYPPPFTRWENFSDYRTWPYRAVGKLFFKRNGQSFVCSASSIGGCAIITAGHCVHAGNDSSTGWSTDVVFVPAYKDGECPFGQWPARNSTTRTQWYSNGIPKGLSEDIGGCVLHKQGGQTISQRVGWLGFAWNQSRLEHWIALGYPAASPFNGQRMQINAASYAYNGDVGASPDPVGMGNDLTGGSSGGPWIRQFGSSYHVNGVNSYRRNSNPKEMFSPYIGNAAKSLYDSLRNASC
jgi:V8-like Glu-specific endopeptidase